MIAALEGTVRAIRKEAIVLMVHGVGYEVFVENPYAWNLGTSLFLFTWQQTREDGQQLFGFEKEQDYEVFTQLINVKGIGPKTAMNILARAGGSAVIEAINSENVRALKALPGIGAKTAGQIVLDLKGKFVSTGQRLVEPPKPITNPVWAECAEALEALGYKPSVIESLQPVMEEKKDLDAAAMLKQALRMLA